MATWQDLRTDVNELKNRISDLKEELHTSGISFPRMIAFVVPTLAERGFKEEAMRLLEELLELRNQEGHWGDFFDTLIAIEALVAMKLRGFVVEGHDDAIKYALKYIKSEPQNSVMEIELRAGRDVILVGLAEQNVSKVDSGIIKVRSAIEQMDWSMSADKKLHGLLALSDLYSVTKEKATLELLEEKIEEFGFNYCDTLSKESVGIKSRAGIVFEKMGKKKKASEYYEEALFGKANSLSIEDLKHRVELGARIFGKELDNNKDVSVEENLVLPSENKKNESIRIEELPAENCTKKHKYKTTAVIIQQDSTDNVVDTIQSVNGMNTKPDELVIVWSGGGSKSFNIKNFEGPVAQVYAASDDNGERRWRMGCLAARGEWVWMIPSGMRVEVDVLKTLYSGITDPTVSAIHLSSSKENLKENLKEIEVYPSIAPGRTLIKNDLLQGYFVEGKTITSDPFWNCNVYLKNSAIWNEVKETKKNTIEDAAKSLEFLATRIEEMNMIRRKVVPESPEARALSAQKMKDYTNYVFNEYGEKGVPFASVIVTDSYGKEAFDKSIESIIKKTNGIPFEIIAVISDETTQVYGKKYEQYGILVLRNSKKGSPATSWNLGADAAQGMYIVFADGSVEVQKDWLIKLINSIQYEGGKAIAGMLIQNESGRVEHAGIAFKEDAEPVFLHKGDSMMMSGLFKKRYYQALGGGIYVLSRKTLRSVGVLNAEYGSNTFIDYCLRAREEGISIVYEPKAKGITLVEKGISKIEIEMLSNRWKNKVQADEEKYLRLEGYDIVESEENNREVRPAGTIHAKENATEADKKREFLNLLARADTMIKDGDFDQAEEVLSGGELALNGKKKNRVLYWTLLGDARFRLNRPDDAYFCYQKAVLDDPEAERAWIGIGTYHLVKEELETADDIFGKIVKLNPKNMRGFLGLGNVELKREKPAEALSYFAKATRLSPGYRPAIVGLVAAAVQSEKMAEARMPLVRYLEEHPEDYEARFHLAAVLYGTNQLELAKAEAERVLQTEPGHAGAKEILLHLNMQ